MADIFEHERFSVALRLAARGQPGPEEADELCGLLRADAQSWSEVAVTPDRDGVQVQVTLTAPDPGAAGDAVVDRVRRLTGLHARFARWTVQARQVRVDVVPG